MQEPLPGIYTWSWYSEPHGYDFNGTLVLHERGNVCVDPPPADERVLRELEERGVAVVVVTNRHHVRATEDVRARTGAAVAMNPLEAREARESVGLDETLDVGARIGPFQVVGVRGKTPGEIALYEPERHILVVGDCVIGSPPGKLSLLPEAKLADPDELRRSVRALLELEVESVLVGDGVSLPSSGHEALERLVATFPAPDS